MCVNDLVEEHNMTPVAKGPQTTTVVHSGLSAGTNPEAEEETLLHNKRSDEVDKSKTPSMDDPKCKEGGIVLETDEAAMDDQQWGIVTNYSSRGTIVYEPPLKRRGSL
ncbi:hypothetical protein M758_UG109100 [Ceratodon purpureus]|nr:hypothetical protein M758_UG109100 [Ceratodon purpureus]